ncbi:MAG: dockerin type I domain-containing protein, partial [Rhodopirellula sp. JB044]|uniref:dockerin type I domain-containing protein n=1 Tax=Rhodopirellula sp. JB044 TaxID=3342844 RepID=UPI00370CE9A5
MSLFSIRDGILEHLVSNPTDTIELELPDSSTDVVLATAADRVGNRSGFNLSEYDLGHVTVNSFIANDPDVTLPARIIVGPETRLTWTGSWDVLSPQSDGEQIIHRIANGTRVIELDNSRGHQNPVNSFDVDRSGRVSSLDALIVINHLNRTINESVQGLSSEGYYLDVNGDSKFSSLDALQVINQLWYHDQPSAEPEINSTIIAASSQVVSRNNPSSRSLVSEPQTIIGIEPAKQSASIQGSEVSTRRVITQNAATREADQTTLDPLCVDLAITSQIRGEF